MARYKVYNSNKIIKKDLKKIEEVLPGFKVLGFVSSIYKPIITAQKNLIYAPAKKKKSNEPELLNKQLIETVKNYYHESQSEELFDSLNKEKNTLLSDIFNDFFSNSKKENHNLLDSLPNNYLNRFNANNCYEARYISNLSSERLDTNSKEFNLENKELEDILIFDEKTKQANRKHVFSLMKSEDFSDKVFSNSSLTQSFPICWLNIYPRKNPSDPDNEKHWGEQVIEVHNELKDSVKIPKIIEVKKDDDNYYIVSENISGKSLDELAKYGDNNAVKKLGAFLANINMKGYETGDPNMANFIMDSNDEIHFIDLEHVMKSKQYHKKLLDNLENTIKNNNEELIMPHKESILSNIDNARAKLKNCNLGYDISFSMWQLYTGYIKGDYSIDCANKLVNSLIEGYESVKKITGNDWELIKSLWGQGLLLLTDDPERSDNENSKGLGRDYLHSYFNYVIDNYRKEINYSKEDDYDTMAGLIPSFKLKLMRAKQAFDKAIDKRIKSYEFSSVYNYFI